MESAPYLGQPFIHSALFRLLDCDLQSLRFARAFWIGGSIANRAVGSFIHISSTASSIDLGHRRFSVGCIRARIFHSSQDGRKQRMTIVRGTARFESRLGAGRELLGCQTQAVTRGMLHDDRCGGRTLALASSCSLWTSRMYWADGLMRLCVGSSLSRPRSRPRHPRQALLVDRWMDRIKS
jgi:hypothetical protein